MVPDGFTAMNYPHVWIGASIVNQAEADRDIQKLLIVPAAKLFISYEPALAPVDFSKWLLPKRGDLTVLGKTYRDIEFTNFISQIIVGGESNQGGANARAFDCNWARSTISQCHDAGVACFVKQIGSNAEDEGDWIYKDRAGADPAEWPEDLRVQEFPV